MGAKISLDADMDPNTADRLKRLQMADLGTARREYISTTDTRNPATRARIEDIEATRMSNKAGSAAHRKAEENKEKLSEWANVHKEIRDTEDLENLDNLLNGQSHRLQLNAAIHGTAASVNANARTVGFARDMVARAVSTRGSGSAGRGGGVIGTRGRVLRRMPSAPAFHSGSISASNRGSDTWKSSIDPALDKNNDFYTKGREEYAQARQDNDRRGGKKPAPAAVKARRPVGNFTGTISSPESFLAEARKFLSLKSPKADSVVEPNVSNDDSSDNPPPAKAPVNPSAIAKTDLDRSIYAHAVASPHPKHEPMTLALKSNTADKAATQNKNPEPVSSKTPQLPKPATTPKQAAPATKPAAAIAKPAAAITEPAATTTKQAAPATKPTTAIVKPAATTAKQAAPATKPVAAIIEPAATTPKTIVKLPPPKQQIQPKVSPCKPVPSPLSSIKVCSYDKKKALLTTPKKTDNILLDFSTTPPDRSICENAAMSPSLQDLKGLDFKPASTFTPVSQEPSSPSPLVLSQKLTFRESSTKSEETKPVNTVTSPPATGFSDSETKQEIDMLCKLLESTSLSDKRRELLKECKDELEAKISGEPQTPAKVSENKRLSGLQHAGSPSPSPQSRLSGTATPFVPRVTSFDHYRSPSSSNSSESTIYQATTPVRKPLVPLTYDGHIFGNHLLPGRQLAQPTSPTPTTPPIGDVHIIGDHNLPGRRSQHVDEPTKSPLPAQPRVTFNIPKRNSVVPRTKLPPGFDTLDATVKAPEGQENKKPAAKPKSLESSIYANITRQKPIR